MICKPAHGFSADRRAVGAHCSATAGLVTEQSEPRTGQPVFCESHAPAGLPRSPLAGPAHGIGQLVHCVNPVPMPGPPTPAGPGLSGCATRRCPVHDAAGPAHHAGVPACERGAQKNGLRIPGRRHGGLSSKLLAAAPPPRRRHTLRTCDAAHYAQRHSVGRLLPPQIVSARDHAL